MRARLTCMRLDLRRQFGLHLWSIYPVNRVQVETSGYKYPRECKWVYTTINGLEFRFLWYEVELIN